MLHTFCLNATPTTNNACYLNISDIRWRNCGITTATMKQNLYMGIIGKKLHQQNALEPLKTSAIIDRYQKKKIGIFLTTLQLKPHLHRLKNPNG